MEWSVSGKEKAMEQEISFEEAMSKLEQIVSQLEAGDVPLEEAIALFQKGMEYSQICGTKLTEVERKIEMIVEQEGQVEKRPFTLERGESF